MTYKEQLLDPRWQKKRLLILERDNWTCRWCANTEKTLHVHHLSYKNVKYAWEACDDVLLTLCSECHSIEHSKVNFTELEMELLQLIQTCVQLGKYKDVTANYLAQQAVFIVKSIKIENG